MALPLVSQSGSVLSRSPICEPSMQGGVKPVFRIKGRLVGLWWPTIFADQASHCMWMPTSTRFAIRSPQIRQHKIAIVHPSLETTFLSPLSHNRAILQWVCSLDRASLWDATGLIIRVQEDPVDHLILAACTQSAVSRKLLSLACLISPAAAGFYLPLQGSV